MSWEQWALLGAAAAGAGVMNAVAGGGTFLTFPALLFAGVAPIRANATSTVALWPGGLASVYAYRHQLPEDRRVLLGMLGASLAGGGMGAVLLLLTPSRVFTLLIPFLLLVAASLFTFNRQILRLVRGRAAAGVALPLPVTVVFQFVVGTYGGYFGAGVGFLMLALFSLLRFENIHRMNALKALLNAAMNAVALVVFVMAGAVDWSKAPLMIAASIAGGYAGAALALRLKPEWARTFVIVTAWSITAALFWKTFGR